MRAEALEDGLQNRAEGDPLYYNHFGLDGKPTNMPYVKPAPTQAPRKSTGVQFTPLNFGDKQWVNEVCKDGQWVAITRGVSKSSWQKPVERTQASFTLPSLPAPESRVDVAPAPATISAAVVQTRRTRTKTQKKKETTHKHHKDRNATQEVAFLREIAQKHKARKQTLSKTNTRGIHNGEWTCKCGLANPNMRTHYEEVDPFLKITKAEWTKMTPKEQEAVNEIRARREKAATTKRATECSKCDAARPVAAVQRRKPARASSEQRSVEERYDEEWQKYFKKHEFRSFYGGYTEWDAAKCTAKFTAKQAEGFFADEASAQTATQTTTWNEQT